MDILNQLSFGFSIALDPLNLLYCFIGVLFGTLVGVLPGLGPVAAMSILMSGTFHASPVQAIIMLAGIYYGAMYGGSTTSILVNIPGEAASVVTCLDGYQMARKGKAGAALGISAFGSFIGGSLGVVGLMVLATFLVKFALRFGPAEYFSLMVFGLSMVAYFSGKSLVKSLMMACFGLFLGTIGTDAISGKVRFTLGTLYLLDRVNLIPVIMGMFGISEVLVNVEQFIRVEVFETRIKGLLPSLKDWRNSIGPILRGTVLGFFLGILPGGGALLASFFSYGLEKRISKHPALFGTGTIEGVAGPETANNAATAGAFIPFLALGIPANAVMALLLGALLIHGIQPGPLLLNNHPEIFWGIIVSMYIGNVMLLVLNLPLIGLWVKLLKIPYRILFPLILLFCLIGSYSIHNSTDDILAMVLFGGLGYICRKLSFDAAPLILALVVGPIMETNFRRALIIGQGDLLMFVKHPISATFLFISFILLAFPFIPFFRRKRVKIGAMMEED